MSVSASIHAPPRVARNVAAQAAFTSKVVTKNGRAGDRKAGIPEHGYNTDVLTTEPVHESRVRTLDKAEGGACFLPNQET